MPQARFIKYPGIPYIEAKPEILKSPVYIFEKIDGGNCQIRNIGGRIIPGSRSNFLEGNRIIDRVHWFKDFVRWVGKYFSNYPSLNLDPNFIIYGEWLAFHNILYNQENMDRFYFIDLFDTEERRFIPYDQALEYLEMMGIEICQTPRRTSKNKVNILRILKKGQVSMGELEKLLNQESDYRESTKEGLVIKDYQNQEFVKILHPEFSEKVESTRNMSEYERYVTQNRYRKTKNALIEEGKEPTLEAIISRIKADVKKGHKVSLKERDIILQLKTLGLI